MSGNGANAVGGDTDWTFLQAEIIGGLSEIIGDDSEIAGGQSEIIGGLSNM